VLTVFITTTKQSIQINPKGMAAVQFWNFLCIPTYTNVSLSTTHLLIPLQDSYVMKKTTTLKK